MTGGLACKRKLARLWSLLPRSTRRGCILTYHSIGGSALGLPAEVFRTQMQWLADNAVVVGVAELVAGAWPQSSTGLACALTFDDGYASVYENALPVLQESGLSATVFLTTAAIAPAIASRSDDFPGLYPGEVMLSWSQVRSLQAAGFNIGSHLVQHKDLSRLSSAEAERELTTSRDTIEQMLGTPCRHLAYPYGRFRRETLRLVRDTGYRFAVTAMHQRLKYRQAVDPLRIPRMDVQRSYTLSDFRALLCGDWDFLGPYQRVRRPLLQWIS